MPTETKDEAKPLRRRNRYPREYRRNVCATVNNVAWDEKAAWPLLYDSEFQDVA
jgi:hypothetical protein